MVYSDRSFFGTHCLVTSRKLKRGLVGLAGEAVARLDLPGRALVITTETGNTGLPDLLPEPTTHDPVVEVTRFAEDEAGFGWLPEEWRGQNLCCYRLRLASGRSDALALRGRADLASGICRSVLAATWSILREDLLSELSSRELATATDAMLWTIRKRVGAAVMVLDPQGQVLQTNAAANELLAAGKILRETREGLRARSGAETQALRLALNECATLSEEKEYIVFLDGGDGMARLPLSLSRYAEAGDRPLIVAVLAARPDPQRIEMLAQKMGLTPAEARVAALLQLGLSNREAAYIAGLKEQTFSTYSKRVLAKLHVGGRAEMAQMLTWQAGLGRAS